MISFTLSIFYRNGMWQSGPERPREAHWLHQNSKINQSSAKFLLQFCWVQLLLLWRVWSLAGAELCPLPRRSAAPLLPPPAPDVVGHLRCGPGGLHQGPRHGRPERPAGGGGEDSGPRYVCFASQLPGGFSLSPAREQKGLLILAAGGLHCPSVPPTDRHCVRLGGVRLSEPVRPLSVPALSARRPLSDGVEQVHP